MQDFAGKIAVITGGGTGMGRELARQLVAQGCDVAMCDVSASNLAECRRICEQEAPQGMRITSFVCDVADAAQMEEFAAHVRDVFATGHINLLFNNAGVAGAGSFLQDDRKLWERIFNICWGGVYLGCRVFLPLLVAAEQGHIVNTSSVNGFWACMGAHFEHTAYSSAKFAVKGFSEALVVDLRLNAPHVKVSVVMPGHIGTDIAIASQGDPDDMNSDDLDRVRKRWSNMDPKAAQLDDDTVRQMVREGGRSFRDDAPTTAAQASSIILDGVRADRWRILVGDDAVALDAAVRNDPENAYDKEFMQLIQSADTRI